MACRSPDLRRRHRDAPQPPQILAGQKASVRSITEACDRLHDLVQNKQVREHDIVAVVIASHLLASTDGVVIAAADTVVSNPPRPAFAASDLGEVLGQLTDYGCRVVVFLDGVHKLEEPLKSEIKPFVRDLQRKRGVITFIASKEGPSGVDRTREHGLFALGVMQVFQGADLAGVRKDRSAAYTLDQFRTALQNEVSNLSARRQQASCYIPTQVPERDPLRQAAELNGRNWQSCPERQQDQGSRPADWRFLRLANRDQGEGGLVALKAEGLIERLRCQRPSAWPLPAALRGATPSRRPADQHGEISWRAGEAPAWRRRRAHPWRRCHPG